MDETVFRIDRFLGVDQSREDCLLEPFVSPNAQNMDTRDGSLRVAKGYVKYVPSALPGMARTLMAFHNRKLGMWQLLAATDNALYLNQYGSWTTLRTGLNSGMFAALNYQIGEDDVLILSNSVDPVLVWNGLALSENATMPRFKYLALNYERMWGAGKALEPDNVYWSKAYEPLDYAGDVDLPERGGGTVLIPTWNGGSVKALMTVFGDVAVFKDYDVHRIIGTYPGNYEVRRVHGVVGPIAWRTIVSNGELCLFLGREGLCVYDGVRASPVGDDRVKYVLDSVNRNYAETACAVIYKQVLYLAVPTGNSSRNDCVIEYDLKRQSYMIRRGFCVESFLVMDDKLLFSCGDYVYEYGVGNTYDGAPIEAFWETPWTELKMKNVAKSSTALYLSGEGPGNICVTADFGRKKKTKTASFPPGFKRMRIRLRAKGRRFRLRFENVDGGHFELLGGAQLLMELDED